jgi:hypothetical protein
MLDYMKNCNSVGQMIQLSMTEIKPYKSFTINKIKQERSHKKTEKHIGLHDKQ